MSDDYADFFDFGGIRIPVDEFETVADDTIGEAHQAVKREAITGEHGWDSMAVQGVSFALALLNAERIDRGLLGANDDG